MRVYSASSCNFLDAVSFEPSSRRDLWLLGANGPRKNNARADSHPYSGGHSRPTFVRGISHAEDPVTFRRLFGYVSEAAAVYRHLRSHV
jgi:hypothetical protein